MAIKVAAISALETELGSLKVTLKSNVEVEEARTLRIDELVQEKGVLEKDLGAATALADSLNVEKQSFASEMQSLRTEVCHGTSPA